MNSIIIFLLIADLMELVKGHKAVQAVETDASL